MVYVTIFIHCEAVHVVCVDAVVNCVAIFVDCVFVVVACVAFIVDCITAFAEIVVCFSIVLDCNVVFVDCVPVALEYFAFFVDRGLYTLISQASPNRPILPSDKMTNAHPGGKRSCYSIKFVEY